MRKTSSPRALSTCVLIVLLFAALPVRADDGAGAFRLGIGLDAFDWHSQDWFRPTGSNSHREGFDVVLLAPRLELQLAGQVIPEIAIGAILGVGWGTQTETALAKASVVSYEVHALAEYAPWPGALARPFVRGDVGVGGAERDQTDASHYSVVLFQVAGTLGVHLFPERSFSISPYGRVYYATGPGTETPLGSHGTNISTSYVAVSVGIELIGWMGGAGPSPALAEPAHERARDVADAATPTLRDGVLSTRVSFFGGARGGELTAEPSRDPSVVEVRFSTTRSELERCETIDLVDGDSRTSVPISVERRTTGSRPRFVVRFGVSTSRLALLASRRASLEACTRRFELAFDSSRTVLAFLASLLELAAETPEPEVVVPPAPTDSASPPADTSEGADAQQLAPPIAP